MISVEFPKGWRHALAQALCCALLLSLCACQPENNGTVFYQMRIDSARITGMRIDDPAGERSLLVQDMSELSDFIKLLSQSALGKRTLGAQPDGMTVLTFYSNGGPIGSLELNGDFAFVTGVLFKWADSFDMGTIDTLFDDFPTQVSSLPASP